jgi:hypothetical protein
MMNPVWRRVREKEQKDARVKEVGGACEFRRHRKIVIRRQQKSNIILYPPDDDDQEDGEEAICRSIRRPKANKVSRWADWILGRIGRICYACVDGPDRHYGVSLVVRARNHRLRAQ